MVERALKIVEPGSTTPCSPVPERFVRPALLPSPPPALAIPTVWQPMAQRPKLMASMGHGAALEQIPTARAAKAEELPALAKQRGSA